MLVFTGGIGENSSIVRELAVKNLAFMGIEIDPALNISKISEDCVISPPDSSATVVVVKANEEKMIAQEAVAILETQRVVNLL